MILAGGLVLEAMHGKGRPGRGQFGGSDESDGHGEPRIRPAECGITQKEQPFYQVRASGSRPEGATPRHQALSCAIGLQ